MALIPTGQSATTATGENRLAHDADGNRVVVSTSFEVIDDFGWRTPWQAAERMYSRGEFVEQEGGTRLVRVTTADCRREVDDADEL